MTGTGHPDETTTALDELLTVLVYMRRSWAEQRTPDWLAEFLQPRRFLEQRSARRRCRTARAMVAT